MKNRYILLLACFLLAQPMFAGNASAENSGNLRLSPALIQIGAFYNGTSVQVTGQIPVAAEAVVRVRGTGEELHLKKKGKVGGLLWMNTGDVTFENAPTVVMLYLPKAISDLEASPFRSFGFPALKEKVEIFPAEEDKDFLFGEFLKMKQKEGLYATQLEAIRYGAGEEGAKTFSVEMAVPTRMKPGSYTVELAVAQDGQLTDTSSAELKIEMVGFPEQLKKLAFGQPLFYGVMAVLIAIAAGLFTGMVFRGKGGAH